MANKLDTFIFHTVSPQTFSFSYEANAIFQCRSTCDRSAIWIIIESHFKSTPSFFFNVTLPKSIHEVFTKLLQNCSEIALKTRLIVIVWRILNYAYFQFFFLKTYSQYFQLLFYKFDDWLCRNICIFTIKINIHILLMFGNRKYIFFLS